MPHNVRAGHGRSVTESLVANVHRLASARENIFLKNCQLSVVSCQLSVARITPFESDETTRTWRKVMPAAIRVLALHAHPDDIEFQCSGTLILLREAGCEVVIATMTPGDCGSAEHDAEAISAIRRDEARAAAALIGAEYLCLEFRDMAIFNDDESRRRVTEALRRVQPAIILTAPPSDYIADHEMTSLLVRDACFSASCPNYTTRQWEPAPAAGKDSPPVFRPPGRRPRSRRPVRASRLSRGRLTSFRYQTPDARLSCEPAQLATPPARDG